MSDASASSYPPYQPSAAPGLMMGCGGCGCLFNLLLMIGGVIGFIIATDEREEEAQVVTAILVGVGLMAGVVALILFVVGIMKNKKASAAFEEQYGDRDDEPG